MMDSWWIYSFDLYDFQLCSPKNSIKNNEKVGKKGIERYIRKKISINIHEIVNSVLTFQIYFNDKIFPS
jgi:hypothetical protein